MKRIVNALLAIFAAASLRGTLGAAASEDELSDGL